MPGFEMIDQVTDSSKRGTEMRFRMLVWMAMLLAGTIGGADTLTAREGGTPTAAAAVDSVISQTLRMLTETAYHPYLKWPDYPHYQDELEALYGPVGFQALWFEDDQPSKQAREVIDALQDAYTHGLNPDDYDAARLAELLDLIGRTRQLDGSELALIDGAISVGFLRYLSDLHIGRVNPENLHFGYNVAEKKLDLAATVRVAIDRDEIRETVARVEPGFPQYARMRVVLADYRELATRELPQVPETEVVHPGDEYVGTEELRTLLIVLGDLPSTTPPAGTTYDSLLAAGVEHF
jgi:murein L,D-transpeptidase YcbB/YkuD